MCAIILDEFYSDLYCMCCKEVVEHNVQKIYKKSDGEFAVYWAKCDICEGLQDYSEEEIFNVSNNK